MNVFPWLFRAQHISTGDTHRRHKLALPTRDVRLKCLKPRVQLRQLFRDNDDEFITADAVHPATRCEAPLHCLGRRTDQLIARRMSARIIDLLEPVHVY